MRKKKNGSMFKLFCKEMFVTKLHVKNTNKKNIACENHSGVS
ncbi:hypothetical protein MtrunA17_Chr6g0452961 [Medicago truncatula]|uniref:Uncharacterized protein n=1 Tax=Medicago truncatula TaxID=3880 RepID=A0A396HFF7_MEDTR|nr:hypothetical protein MtrunA17_Chr6g0452961 [Medicago truncatula]